ncbi:hypothetical protein AgCh_000245 [Apium graveolens]
MNLIASEGLNLGSFAGHLSAMEESENAALVVYWPLMFASKKQGPFLLLEGLSQVLFVGSKFAGERLQSCRRRFSLLDALHKQDYVVIRRAKIVEGEK